MRPMHRRLSRRDEGRTRCTAYSAAVAQCGQQYGSGVMNILQIPWGRHVGKLAMPVPQGLLVQSRQSVQILQNSVTGTYRRANLIN